MNPLKLTFTANEQDLTKTDNFTDFASNTVSYIEATFTLGENWSGYDSVRAVWKTDYYTISTVLDANFTCIVPTEVLRYKAKVFVNLVGSIVENDTLTDRLTTFPVLALTVKANAAVNGSETAPVTPSQFEQFVETVQNAAESISDYSYDSEAWAVGKRGGVDVPSTDETYHNNSKYWAEQNAGLSDEVADLKEELNSKIDIDGEHQVTPQNIDGVAFTKTQEEQLGEELFSESYLGENGYYASLNTNVTPPVITHALDADFRWYAIPVEANSKYVFTQARFAFLAKGNTLSSEGIAPMSQYITEITTTAETTHLILTYLNTITSVSVKKSSTVDVYSNFVMPSWMQGFAGSRYASATAASITDNGALSIASVKNNLRKGERIVIYADITSFTSIRLNYAYSDNGVTNFIDVNETYITVKNSSTDHTAHGLTIVNNLTLEIEQLDNNTAKITLTSNGNSYSHVYDFTRQSVAFPLLSVINASLTNVKMTWTCTDLCKNIWFFGDSYVGYATTRWAYYLKEQGYDKNILLDGFPGEGSVNARVSFNNLLKFGVPKFAVWCMGMNDSGDSSDEPSENWVSGRNLFLQYCSENGVTPIFGTIPTVPSINNEQKNAWIRSSGYRYIDFAKAVGANASGQWYGGMLSSDNVHPTEQGARALFARVLLDLPEIMVDDFGY